MKRTRLLLFVISSLVSVNLLAQEKITISGKVTSQDSPEGLPGVTLLVEGTTQGTVSDMNGQYTIEAEENSTIVASFIGYITQRIQIGNRSTVDIVMEQDIQALEEVVVVGYGTQKKANLTGSVSSVSSELIDARPITSASSALQGTTSGVFINQNSGQPGRDDVVIRIRGVGTLNDANPLVLVDGIEAPLNNINPDDIESMTVLKDAASASIYGSRASNGVILVTTKRGSRTEGVNFNYNGYYGVSEAIQVPEMVTNSALFAELWNEAYENFGNQPRYSDEEIENFRQNGPNTDFIGELFSPAPIQQHNFSASGASDKTNFRLSFGYLDQEGVVPGANFKRYNTRLNLDSRVTDKLTIGTSISLVRGDRNSSREDLTADGDGSLLANAARSLPLDRIYDDNGVLMTPRYGFNNVFIDANRANYHVLTNEILANGYLEYEIIEGLKVKGTTAINYREGHDDDFRRTLETVSGVTGDPIVEPNTTRSRYRKTWKRENITSWLQATYEKQIKDHFIKGLIGFNQETSKYDEFSAGRNTFISNEIKMLDVGDPATATNGEWATAWALQSYFARLNYNYKGKYLFEANIRRDGSSRFENEKWGTFPSFSGGWIVSEESFFNVPIVDFLKVRASWGQLGNQNIGDFAYARQLSLNQNYSFSGTIVQGTAQTSLGNPDLVWETSTSTNIGINLGLLQSKIDVEADYFTRRTEDILFNIPIPSITGFGTQISNSAIVENKGWELAVNYNDDFGPVKLNIGANVTHVESEIVQLNNTLGDDEIDRRINGFTIWERGAPVNAYYGHQSLGLFRSQEEYDGAPDHTGLDGRYGVGDVRRADIDGNGIIDNEDRTVIGKPDPTWLFGMNLSVGFKGFELMAIMQGAADFYGYAEGEIAQPFNNSAQLHSMWLDRWTPDNPDASMPRLYETGGPSTAGANSFWLMDRSYVRMKNIQLSYTIPSTVLDNTFIKSLRVYVNAQNLFTITNFPFFDPERPATNPNAGGSEDRGGQGFPNLRIISGGLNINF